jgi:hypothetical protein
MPSRRRRKVAGQQTVVASAARTTTGNSGAFQGWARLGNAAGTPQQRLAITASGGTTQNLVLTLEDSPNGSTWTTRDTFPAQTGTATVTRALPAGLDVYQRYVWTITGGGGQTFTFSVQIAASTDSLV